MKPRKKFQEEVLFTTVRITIPGQSMVAASIGTGFLFQAPVGDARHVVLLVSNKHVYRGSSNPIVLNFHKRDPNDTEAALLGQTVTLGDQQFAGVYYEHPNPDIDLACINISKISDPTLGIFYRTLNTALLCDLDDANLFPGCEVWFVGYPENRFDTTHNLPILRRGFVASIPRVDFESQPQLLIDAQVFPGSSGSPVFVALNGKFRLLGVVTQTMIRNQKLQAVPAATAVVVQQVLGLGIVLKAHLVRELVDSIIVKIVAELACQQARADKGERTIGSSGRRICGR
jgi:hypothetical protein